MMYDIKWQEMLCSDFYDLLLQLTYFLLLGVQTSLQTVLVLSQLGDLTVDFVDNYTEMSHLLKKLAFAEVYILLSNNQVTLLGVVSLRYCEFYKA